jgi:hypothetical protein
MTLVVWWLILMTVRVVHILNRLLSLWHILVILILLLEALIMLHLTMHLDMILQAIIMIHLNILLSNSLL